jgi:hypothetical protein
MISATWRGWQRWRSDDEDATFDDVSIDSADPAVDELLTALTAQARPHEVEGLSEPLAAYRATFAGRRQLVPTAASSGLLLTGLLGTKAAAAAGGVALGLAATAMVVAVNLPTACADRTPVPAAASSSAQPTTDGKGVGPDAKGPAAHGLCTAWSNHRRNGDTAAMDSVPMRNLATAAGGEGKIAAYCAAVPDPGTRPKTPKPGKTKPTTGQGKQDKGRDTGDDDAPGATRKPTPKPTAKPTAKPTTSSSRTAPSPSSGPRAATPKKGS